MRPHVGGARRLNVELTDRCNANCLFCPRDEYFERVGELSDMSWPSFKAIMSEAIALYHPKFVNFGVFGEPTLCSYLVDAVSFSSRLGLKTRLTTNAFLLDEPMAWDLLEAGLSTINFSVDEIDKVPFEALRKGMNFERCLSNVSGFWDILHEGGFKCHVTIYPVLCEENEDRMVDILNFWSRYSHSCVASPEVPVGPGHRAKPWDVSFMRKRFWWVYQLFGLTPHCFDWMVIRANGDLVPCCLDSMKEEVLGNVFEDSLKLVWEGPVAEAFRDRVEGGDLPPLCQRCRFRSFFR